jgi:putative oxidoreductase
MQEERPVAFLRQFEPHAYALLRIVAGLLFIFHGLQKFGMFGGKQVELASIYGAAAVIEVVSGALIMIGLMASPLAFLASGEMAYAYFTVHQPNGTWPIENQGELAALYAFIFLYIATRGSGIWSVDGARSGGARKYRSR